MKATFISYEHTRVGFPRVVLKWCEENGQAGEARVVVNGLIQPEGWTWHNRYASAFYEYECRRFDEWVGKTYAEDASVQG